MGAPNAAGAATARRHAIRRATRSMSVLSAAAVDDASPSLQGRETIL
jgi:hypothetical protein